MKIIWKTETSVGYHVLECAWFQIFSTSWRHFLPGWVDQAGIGNFFIQFFYWVLSMINLTEQHIRKTDHLMKTFNRSFVDLFGSDSQSFKFHFLRRLCDQVHLKVPLLRNSLYFLFRIRWPFFVGFCPGIFERNWSCHRQLPIETEQPDLQKAWEPQIFAICHCVRRVSKLCRV